MDTIALIAIFSIIGWYVATLLVFVVPPFRREVTPFGIVASFVTAVIWQSINAIMHWGFYGL